MRSTMFILYARTFDDCPDTIYLSMIVYCSYFVSALLSVLNSIIGDRYSFDYVLCFAAMCDSVTFCLEATAKSFITLAFVCIVLLFVFVINC